MSRVGAQKVREEREISEARIGPLDGLSTDVRFEH
jgi:hypothetical protein